MTPRTVAAQRARIHLNIHVLRRNGKAEPGGEAPPIAVERTREDKGYAHQVVLGRDLVIVRYDPARDAGQRCHILANHGVAVGGQRVLGRAEVLVLGTRIKANIRATEHQPVLFVRHGSEGQEVPHTVEVHLLGPAGEVVGAVLYRPHKPLSCGARVWVESTLPVSFRDRDGVPCLPVRLSSTR